MKSPLFIVPATTTTYQAYARRLIQSAKDCSWNADFLVLEESDDFRGRFIKTSFAKHLSPDQKSQVILIDADTLATGPLDLPKVAGDVAALRLCANLKHLERLFPSRHPEHHVFDTFMLVFPNVESASKVSEIWHAAWLKMPGLDMPAFNQSTHLFACESLPFSGTRSQPTPYLKHLVK